MHRRTILTLAAALPFVTAKGTPARAEKNPADANPVRIRLDDGRFALVSRVVIAARDMPLALAWQGAPAFFDENRLDLSRAAPFFREPFGDRWAGARSVGTVSLRDDMLIVLLAEPEDLMGRRITLGAGDASWDLPGALAPHAGGMPITDRRAPIGGARLERDGALLLRLAGSPAA